MKNTKFVVKVDRGGTRAAEYVQRVGRFTAEDAVKAIQTSRCTPELVSVDVHT
jgi:hypothetical protein